MYLGVDGGGTKTAYALIDADGQLRATHYAGSVSHLSGGVAAATALLGEGLGTVLAKGNCGRRTCRSHTSDCHPTARTAPRRRSWMRCRRRFFDAAKYRCGNDMICSWAGAFACRDGVSVIAGTGSMVYGEYAGRCARAGGWGELIGDEGSAYWLAREGMNLFSRMSDGRAARGPLYELVRARLGLDIDLDLCARVYGETVNTRAAFAQFAPLVDAAAQAGDGQARTIFVRAADELAVTVGAVRRALAVPGDVVLPVSYSGGAFSGSALLLRSFRDALADAALPFDCRPPLFPPLIGAALYAARLAGSGLSETALTTLRAQCAARGVPP